MGSDGSDLMDPTENKHSWNWSNWWKSSPSLPVRAMNEIRIDMILKRNNNAIWLYQGKPPQKRRATWFMID